MIYPDDDSKSEFARTTQMLQVIVSIFETNLFVYGREAEMIDIMNDNQVFIGVPNLHSQIMEDLKEKLNAQFKRKDGLPTCDIQEPEEYGIFRFYATSLNDLSFPH